MIILKLVLIPLIFPQETCSKQIREWKKNLIYKKTRNYDASKSSKQRDKV